jgi:hypothetical protein
LLSKLSDFQRAVGQHQLAGLDPVAQIGERLRGLSEQVLTRAQCLPLLAVARSELRRSASRRRPRRPRF